MSAAASSTMHELLTQASVYLQLPYSVIEFLAMQQANKLVYNIMKDHAKGQTASY